jgi:hypothetical protein
MTQTITSSSYAIDTDSGCNWGGGCLPLDFEKQLFGDKCHQKCLFEYFN